MSGLDGINLDGDQGEDGAALLDELLAAVLDYVVLPTPEAAIGVVLWIAATHCLAAFEHATRLVIKSPEKRCGKSRLLEVIAALCHNALVTANVSEAAVFRSLGDDPPTLLLDEADSMFGTRTKAEQNEGLRGLLNAGYRPGLPVLRTVGPTHEVMQFPTFAMAALAGIGSMPDTIEDRAVVITMRRRARGESVKPYRFRRDKPVLDALHSRLVVWAASVVDGMAEYEPDLPLEDRAADTWEPLVMVADTAGGRWPELARAAATVMVKAELDDGQSAIGPRLLRDILATFAAVRGVAFLSSRTLTERLRDIEESSWVELNLTTHSLAGRLRKFGIRPGLDASGTTRGYRLDSFLDSFERYLPSDAPELSDLVKPQRTSAFSSDTPDPSDTPDRHTEPSSTRPAGPIGECGHELLSPQSRAVGKCGSCVKKDEAAAAA